jgi:hypothetical protein
MAGTGRSIFQSSILKTVLKHNNGLQNEMRHSKCYLLREAQNCPSSLHAFYLVFLNLRNSVVITALRNMASILNESDGLTTLQLHKYDLCKSFLDTDVSFRRSHKQQVLPPTDHFTSWLNSVCGILRRRNE